MDNVVILEAPEDMQDGVCFADVGEELVAEPSPLLAPFTNPAMSTISTVVGTVFWGWTISTSFSRRASGTLITPRLGSMVQNENSRSGPSHWTGS